jgi:hypothetical protein
VARDEKADAVLTGTVVAYRLEPLAYEDARRTATEEYRVVAAAKIVLTRTDSGEVVAEHPYVQGEATFPLEGDLTSAKRNALPELARDLAHDIVEKVVEYW